MMEVERFSGAPAGNHSPHRFLYEGARTMGAGWLSARVGKAGDPCLGGLPEGGAKHRHEGAGLSIANAVSCFLHRKSCHQQFDGLHQTSLAAPGLETGPDLALKDSLDGARARAGIL